MKGITGENLLFLLERRLDNTVYRAGFPPRAGRRVNSSTTGTSKSTGAKLIFPHFRLSRATSISVKGSEPQEPARRRRLADCGRSRASGLDCSRRRRGDERARHDAAHSRRTLTARLTSNSSSSFTASNAGQRGRTVRPFRSPRRGPRGRVSPHSRAHLIKRLLKIMAMEQNNLWTGFQMPRRLAAEGETLTERYGRFSAQPFERGFGTTIGNSLRRALLSSIEGAAITAVKIEGVEHEFSSIQAASSRMRPTLSSISSRFLSNCTGRGEDPDAFTERRRGRSYLRRHRSRRRHGNPRPERSHRDRQRRRLAHKSRCV